MTAPETPSRRPRRRHLVAVVVCAAAAGLTAWLLPDSGRQTGTCEDLLGDKRVRTALGGGYRSGMSCSALGSAVVKATVDAAPHQHSLQQAQSMKTVLVAVGESLARTGGRIDTPLRTPLADALADYTPDTASVLGIADAEYVVHAVPAKPAWKDKDGVHMAVTRGTLLRVLRGVSRDPAAYATVRAASTRYTAEQLAAVPRGATGYALTVAPARVSRLLGSLDAVADGVRRDLGDARTKEWERDVFAQETKRAATPPSYTKDPVEHLVGTWSSTLRAGGFPGGSDALEQQSGEMVDEWAKALGVTAGVRSTLRENALNDSSGARGDALRDLS
ncbi:hypothetical protein [Streptomyces malaysiense]|uniref:Uncharacterized protein n=1 Tax=Streptomyces malaysiense TaxID=1428626 RepID=A0A1J4PYX0_9ACTN|nr:hypothetical protein [Streptomyces malaysiense]OIK25890.1 hypothetical protein VT52_019425 [Streptomyces malaysiense]